MNNSPELQRLCAADERAEKKTIAAFENPQPRPDGETDAFVALEDARERLAIEVEKTRKYLEARR